MLDAIDREAMREGFAISLLRSYNTTRKGNGKSDPKTGVTKLPGNIDVDIARILHVLRN